MNFSPMVLAAADTAATPSGGSTLISMLITFVPILLVFYFFLIRPQKKREREERDLRDNLSVGDEIVTIGGIIGIVVRQNDDTLVIETGGDRSKLRIQRSAVRENITARENAQASSASPKTIQGAAELLEKKQEKKEKEKSSKKSKEIE